MTAEEEALPEEAPEERVEDYLAVDILGVEIGYGLIPIVDQSQGGDFLDRITTLRRQTAQELGVIVPPVRVRDNISLGANAYVIQIRGNRVASGELEPGLFLAMNPGYAEEELKGVDTIEPAFGLNAKWIDASEKEKAELAGYTVVEPSSVLATHLSEIIKSHAYEILTRQDVKSLVDNVKRDYPVLVEDLIPQTLSLGMLQKILNHLLKERVPVRDLVAILEAVGDYAATTKDPFMLGEFARAALYRTITKQYIDEEGKLTVFTVSPQIERMIMDNMQTSVHGAVVNLAPDISQKIFTSINTLFDQMIANDKQPVVLVSSAIRLPFRSLTDMNFSRLAVLAYNEITPETEIFSVGMVNIET